MTPENWQMFHDMIQRILNLPGTWEEKSSEVVANCDVAELSNLGEFVSWFGGLIRDE